MILAQVAHPVNCMSRQEKWRTWASALDRMPVPAVDIPSGCILKICERRQVN